MSFAEHQQKDHSNEWQFYPAIIQNAWQSRKPYLDLKEYVNRASSV